VADGRKGTGTNRHAPGIVTVGCDKESANRALSKLNENELKGIGTRTKESAQIAMSIRHAENKAARHLIDRAVRQRVAHFASPNVEHSAKAKMRQSPGIGPLLQGARLLAIKIDTELRSSMG